MQHRNLAPTVGTYIIRAGKCFLITPDCRGRSSTQHTPLHYTKVSPLMSRKEGKTTRLFRILLRRFIVCLSFFDEQGFFVEIYVPFGQAGR